MNYDEAVEYLLSFNDMERGVQISPNPTMSLASMRSLLSRLDNPQNGRESIHITGSKGKGSVAAMVEAILRHSGQRTALYTSPHLHSFTERIALDGEAISPPEFATGLSAIRGAIEAEQRATDGAVSTFGILTALFFWMTRAQAPHVDWQVVEVGLGGTYDATNVLEAPAIAIITPISLEHTAILGKTAAEIARDKAGIVQAGTTCVLAAQDDPTVVEVVKERCRDVGATLVDVGTLYETDILERYPYGQSFHVQSKSGTREFRTQMLGRHQAANATTAVAVADVLRERGVAIPTTALWNAISRTRLPGRAEVMGQAPAIVADGAHNEASAEALANTLKEYLEWRRCIFVVGASKDKDIRGMAFKLGKIATSVIGCRFSSARAAEPDEITSAFEGLHVQTSTAESVRDAIQMATAMAEPEDLICITGSLYVAAEARTAILGELVTNPREG